MKVGTIVTNRFPLLGNPAGTRGVAYWQYQILGDKEPGLQFIFSNGEYDGFSVEEQENMLEEIGFSEALSIYKFSNVIQLSKDYEAGYFNPAFTREAENGESS